MCCGTQLAGLSFISARKVARFESDPPRRHEIDNEVNKERGRADQKISKNEKVVKADFLHDHHPAEYQTDAQDRDPKQAVKIFIQPFFGSFDLASGILGDQLDAAAIAVFRRLRQRDSTSVTVHLLTPAAYYVVFALEVFPKFGLAGSN